MYCDIILEHPFILCCDISEHSFDTWIGDIADDVGAIVDKVLGGSVRFYWQKSLQNTEKYRIVVYWQISWPKIDSERVKRRPKTASTPGILVFPGWDVGSPPW